MADPPNALDDSPFGLNHAETGEVEKMLGSIRELHEIHVRLLTRVRYGDPARPRLTLADVQMMADNLKGHARMLEGFCLGVQHARAQGVRG